MRIGGAALYLRTAAHIIVFVAVALTPARGAAAAAFARGRVVVPTRHVLAPSSSSSPPSSGSFRRRMRQPPLCGVTTTAQGGRADEDDLVKWERMYYQSETRCVNTSPASSGRSSDEVALGGTRVISQVRVVSFDLDNTVWRTSPTIASANDALSEFLQERHGVPSTVRVEKIMKELSQSDPGRYNPAFAAAVAAATADKGAAPAERLPRAAPVLLTRLRKDAIRVALRDHGGEGAPDGDHHDEAAISARIDRAFDRWVEARHDAISSHMADDVAVCLSRIASMRTAEGHPVLIGAITDGNSDPSLVKALEPFFDFCVNAERVGVAKPDKRLYLEAAAIAASHPGVQAAVVTTAGGATAEDTVGPWWVHIGDDFIKDVVAAKSLGMRSVWCRELVNSSSSSAGRDDLTAPRNAADAPSRSVEDLVKQVSEMKVVRMEVGADDYMAASLHDEFADAVVDRFSHVSTLLHEWHEEGLASHSASDEPAKYETFGGSSLPLDETKITGSLESSQLSSSAERKFCIHCGSPLPAVAAFCSGCGQKQI